APQPPVLRLDGGAGRPRRRARRRGRARSRRGLRRGNSARSHRRGRRSGGRSGGRMKAPLVFVLAAALAAPIPAPLTFPRDHGAHSDALGGWYWTGHLSGDEGRAYGFQLTFFRLRDLHLAHFAWSDIAAGKFQFEE